MKTLVRPALRRPVAVTARTGAGTRPPARSSARQETFTTVTLLRGRVYFFRNVEFRAGIETAIDVPMCSKTGIRVTPEEFAMEIEDLYENVTDSDNEEFSKPLFQVRRNRPRPLSEKEQEERARPRRIRQFVDAPRHTEDEGPVRATRANRPGRR